MKPTKADEIERGRHIKELRKLLRKGSVIYSIVRHVSRSGMQREIDLYYFDRRGEKHWLSYNAAAILGWRLSRNRGIIVKGCGMDMCFHTVYSLSIALFRGAKGVEQGREGYVLRSEVL